MPETFEEIVGRRLPGLYAAARFVAAGDDQVAEELLSDALATAFSRHGTWEWDPTGLECALVDEVLRRWRLGIPPAGKRTPGTPRGGRNGPRIPPPSVANDVLAGVDITHFNRSARSLPLRARVAIWLVSLERWRYDEAAKALGVERDELLELLAWRDTLLAESLAGPQHARRKAAPE